jgi:hypothetical protein
MPAVGERGRALNAEGLWWLSYADDEGARGVVLTRAPSFLAACVKARRMGLSPGGQVAGGEVVNERALVAFAPHIDRLLTPHEARALTEALLHDD